MHLKLSTPVQRLLKIVVVQPKNRPGTELFQEFIESRTYRMNIIIEFRRIAILVAVIFAMTRASPIIRKRQTATSIVQMPRDLIGGLTLAKVNTILSLVGIAENGDTNWSAHYNYIENINDNRGYTISIVGFCTGTGDFLDVLNVLRTINPQHRLVKYIPTVQTKVAGDVTGLDTLPADVRSLGTTDIQFNSAAWVIIKRLYWNPAMQFCQRHNLVSPLAKYIVYDTIINFGELIAFEGIRSNGTESQFLQDFLTIKQQTIVKDTTLGDTQNNRVQMQETILRNGNLQLTTPMQVTCYNRLFTVN